MDFTVPQNNIGIEAMFTTKSPIVTNPKYRDKHKLMLHSTATPGAPAQNFFNGWNKSSAGAGVEFVLDNEKILQYLPIGDHGKNALKSWHCGGEGNNTYIATEVCEPTETQLIPINYYEQGRNCKVKRTYAVKRIQMELEERGYYNGQIDGSFGSATEAAVKAFQGDNGLSADGVVGKKTLAKLADREGSYAAYDVKGATPFFNAAYNNAVALFGFLCNYVNAKPEEIRSHAEGYQMGIASNHADVGHWFPLHGKSMDDFRNDVAAYVKGTWVPLGTTVEEKPEYNPLPSDEAYLTAIDQLHDAGIMEEDAYFENLLTNGEDMDMGKAHAFIADAGEYFVTKDFTAAVDSLVASIGINSPLYWKGEVYSAMNIGFLLKAIAGAAKETSTDMELAIAVDICHDMGVLNDVDYWKEITDGSINVGNVRILLGNAARYFIKQDWKYGVYAIENLIGMTSTEWWLTAEQYSLTNFRYLVTGLAKLI